MRNYAIQLTTTLKILIFPGRLFEGGIDHAGKIETSLMLAVNKKLVHMDRLIKPTGSITGDDANLASEIEGKNRLEKVVNQIINEIKVDY